MTLLFITQKLHQQDAFGILWIRAFIKRGYKVKVICLEDRVSDDINDLEIYSMGKEKGFGKLRQILRFFKYILILKYDCVFIHMSPIWGLLGCDTFIVRRKPTYLWYTHYKHSFSVRVTEFYAKRIFCATEQSAPWLKSGSGSKKVVVGHGIDLNYWQKRENHTQNPHALIMVHRLSRSKRVEISLRALKLLPNDYTLNIYGIEAEKDYVAEIKSLVKELDLESRVVFKGTVPMQDLKDIYSSHQLILNMALETIDKTMLEAMTCGCYPVTTARNAESIGIKDASHEDTPEALADFIQNFHRADANELYRIVSERHSLDGLIIKMDEYISNGA